VNKIKEVFLNDLLYILNLTTLIDKMYGDQEKNTYHYLKKLRKIVDRFNEKYPEIHVAVNKTSLNIRLKFFVREDSVDNVFKNHSLKESIFGDEKLIDFKFKQKMDKTFTNEMTDTLALKKDINRNMVEVIYRNDTLDNPYSAEFNLLAKHALTNVKDIEIKEEQDDIFCFDFDMEKGKGIIYSVRDFKNNPSY